MVKLRQQKLKREAARDEKSAQCLDTANTTLSTQSLTPSGTSPSVPTVCSSTLVLPHTDEPAILPPQPPSAPPFALSTAVLPFLTEEEKTLLKTLQYRLESIECNQKTSKKLSQDCYDTSSEVILSIYYTS